MAGLRILNTGKDSDDVFTQLMAIDIVRQNKEQHQLKLEQKLNVASGFPYKSDGCHNILRAKFLKGAVIMFEQELMYVFFFLVYLRLLEMQKQHITIIRADLGSSSR